MFGFYRFFLALLVALSHINNPFPEFHLGAVSVVSFYLISGYVMTALYTTKFAPKKNPIFSYYLDRFFRLFPLYWLYLFTFLLCFWLFSFPLDLSYLKLSLNFFLLPTNYYAFIPLNLLKNSTMPLIEPIWSVALELHFYFLLPFLIFLKSRSQLILWFSFGLFLLFSYKSANPFLYAYSLPFSVLFLFLAGQQLYFYSSIRSTTAAFNLISLWFLTLLYLFFLVFKHQHLNGFNLEALSGLLIGLPLTFLLSRFPSHSHFDRYFGQLSYGIFLNHLPLKTLLFPLSYRLTLTDTLLTLLLSMLLSCLSFYFLEKPLNQFRARLSSR